MTKLENFLRAKAIKPADLARASKYSRQHLLRVRKGLMEPSRRCIKAITRACRQLSKTKVRASRLFDLDS